MITLAGFWWCLCCDESGTGTLTQVDKAADRHTRSAGHGTVAGAVPTEVRS